MRKAQKRSTPFINPHSVAIAQLLLDTEDVVTDVTDGKPLTTATPRRVDDFPGEAAARLAVALIVNAVEDAMDAKAGKGGWGNAQRTEALRWLRSAHDAPCSFQWCCRAIGIDERRVVALVEHDPYWNRNA